MLPLRWTGRSAQSQHPPTASVSLIVGLAGGIRRCGGVCSLRPELLARHIKGLEDEIGNGDQRVSRHVRNEVS